MLRTKNIDSLTAEQKKDVTTLDLSNQNLVGKLNLQGFNSLQVLICSHNKLEELEIDATSLTNLVHLDCSYNKIKKIKLTGHANNNCLEKFIANDNCLREINNFLNLLNPKKLLYLDIRNNINTEGRYYDNDKVNLYSRSNHSYYNNYNNNEHLHSYTENFPLTNFSKFNELEVLMIGNEREKSFSDGQSSYEKRFSGSLKDLKDLVNLKRLWVRNCQITGGLEYLTENLEYFDYQDSAWIEGQLKSYLNNQDNSNQTKDPLVAWREAQIYYKLYQEVKKEELQKKEEEIASLQDKLKEKETNIQTLNSEKILLQGELSIKQNELKQAEVKFASYQKFVSDQLQNKKNNLEKLIQQTKNKLEENQVWLEAFLSARKEVNKNSNNTFAQEQVEKARSILNKKLTEEEIQSLLKKQNKLAQLEKKLTDLQIYENKIEVSPK